MFLGYNYETKTLTNTIEQLVISDHVISPLENQTIDNMIEAAVPLIFNFDFPFYVDASAPEYATAKLAFEKTFCLQYFREQIGLETIGEFQYHLKRILTVNNPYYEQLYRSITFEYNPIITHNSTRKVTSTKDDTRTGVISGDSTAKTQLQQIQITTHKIFIPTTRRSILRERIMRLRWIGDKIRFITVL